MPATDEGDEVGNRRIVYGVERLVEHDEAGSSSPSRIAVRWCRRQSVARTDLTIQSSGTVKAIDPRWLSTLTYLTDQNRNSRMANSAIAMASGATK
jgi:hypothetical protein